MASINMRQHDPLFEPETQAIIERRAKELAGVVLVLLSLVFTLMLISYSPEDPGWMAATDTPAQNLLGKTGATLSSALIVIIGKASWMLSIILLTWGGRLISHHGADKIATRAPFAVIIVALTSIFMSTLPSSANWQHDFGMGGLFGDTTLGMLVSILPITSMLGLTLLSVTLGITTVISMLWVTAFDKNEISKIVHTTMRVSLLALGWLLNLIRKSIRKILGTRHQTEPPAISQPSRFQSNSGLVLQTPEPHIQNIAFEKHTIECSPLILPQISAHPPEKTQESFHSAGEKTDDNRIRDRITKAVQARFMRDKKRVLSINHAIPKHGMMNRSEPEIGMGGSSLETHSTVNHRHEPVIKHHPSPVEENLYSAEEDNQYTGHDHDKGNLISKIPERKGTLVQPMLHKSHKPSQQALSETQPKLCFGTQDDNIEQCELPPLSLLSNTTDAVRHQLSNEALEENARMLESVLDDYGIRGEIVSVRPGPVVTMYELEPAPGLKASRVMGLADDIARSMSALSARVSTVPGRTVIGIELPNAHREKVILREILSARGFGDSNMRLPLALGKDIGGEPAIANLAKMPHLLIAGTTGSGKSVAINTMILSLLYKLTPEECRLIMIDPKMLELSVYDGIPHLLSPVVTDPKKAVVALKWVVSEMEERYRKMSKMGVRNIDGYNARVKDALGKSETFKRTIQTGFDDKTGEPIFETEEFEPRAFPYIVVIVDEMADLMMVAGKEIEACIQRLAQMARASGIHLIMATQRPSVDVITGTIKANFPTRISFQVTSKIDSRTILGEQGAEQLLGMGDMLYMGNGARITRIHGPFVSDEEVEEVVNHLKSYGPPKYVSGVLDGPGDDKADDIDMILGLGGGTEGDNALYDQAIAIVAKDRKCSTSYIQRKLGIGYNKAARLVEQMEEQDIVTPANHVGKRDILIPEH